MFFFEIFIFFFLGDGSPEPLRRASSAECQGKKCLKFRNANPHPPLSAVIRRYPPFEKISKTFFIRRYPPLSAGRIEWNP